MHGNSPHFYARTSVSRRSTMTRECRCFLRICTLRTLCSQYISNRRKLFRTSGLSNTNSIHQRCSLPRRRASNRGSYMLPRNCQRYNLRLKLMSREQACPAAPRGSPCPSCTCFVLNYRIAATTPAAAAMAALRRMRSPVPSLAHRQHGAAPERGYLNTQRETAARW